MVSPSPAYDGPDNQPEADKQAAPGDATPRYTASVSPDPLRGEVAPPPAPRPGDCSNVAARALLVPYALSQCPETEATTFEAHLLTCDSCFKDLKCLDRASRLILEARSQGFGATPPAPPEADMRDARIREAMSPEATNPEATSPEAMARRGAASPAPERVEEPDSKKA